MLTQKEAMGTATASDGERAPIASFWVRTMVSCINIKRGVWDINDKLATANLSHLTSMIMNGTK